MAERETIVIVDFGAQYNQLIARRVRENRVYSEVVPYDVSIDRIREIDPIGIIFTGGPSSTHQEGAPKVDPAIYDLGIPILGICYGAQLMAEQLGGITDSAEIREYGKKALDLKNAGSKLLRNVGDGSVCWMSHTDYIEQIPDGFEITAITETCPVAAFENEDKKLYGVQYHPEVEHTENGKELLTSFIYDICGAEGTWTMANYIDEQVAKIREKVGDRKVLAALSGGVDSSVASALMHRAVGDQLTCIFVDHGLLRKDEGDQVEEIFKDKFGMNLSAPTSRTASSESLRALRNRNASARSSAKNLSVSSKKNPTSSAILTTCCRERSTRMLSNPVRRTPRRSRATTMWADFRKTSTSS